MEKRALTIDLLRGVAIIGMVLSGQILWNAELPAWMFHAQVPPPEFRFDPTVPGITWVDLVFPFFLFSMGAAFPLALRKRLDARHESTGGLVGTILRRWALLVVFAIALANLAVEGTGIPMWGAALVRLAGWGCFCLLFMRFERLSKGQNRWVCLAGVVLLTALLAACRCVWGAPVTVERSNIIILVLANMALFGSLVWLFTRDRLPLRLAILALFVALRLGSSVEGSWNEALWNASPLPWLFQIDFLKYLCIIIPGTIAGDAIHAWMSRRETPTAPAAAERETALMLLAAALIPLNLWGLFSRHLTANLLANLALCAAGGWLLHSRRGGLKEPLHRTLFDWGCLWLLMGLALEAFEGGIKKDPATYSYFFTTSGLASMFLVAAEIALRRFRLRCGVLVRCGQNPMIAYTAAGFLITPVLTLLHLTPLLNRLGAVSPWMGVLRGAIMTTAVALVTALFTRRRIFWRS